MARKPIPTYYLAAVVVRQGDQFLLVQEHKRGAPWSLPAGRAEPGETLAEAAVRETVEESGVRVRLTGILRIEHSPRERRARVRAVFLGEPIGDPTPKQEPDEESLGARWVTVEEAGQLELRRPEVEHLLRYVAAGGVAFPLELLQEEGTPYFGIGDGADGLETTRLSGALRWLKMAITGEHPIDS
jgi:phosphatase NudJ